jgi:ABC-type transport system substrate-binding protein
MLTSPGPIVPRQRVSRRDFLKHAAWGGAAATAVVAGRRPAHAQGTPSYPDWIPPSPKAPKRGGSLSRATAWDPPVLDPRLTNSVGLFQIASLVCNRLVRYPFADEASGTSDLTLKGDLAESWQGSPDSRVWTFKLRQGVKWQNVPPLNGREFVAADVKYCYEQYAKEGVQAFTFRKSRGWRRPTSTPCASI